MACYHPLSAWRGKGGKITFKSHEALNLEWKLDLPCGQCIGCMIKRKQEWGLRCKHEASLHKMNAFVTLTYDDDKIPEFGSLRKEHLQKFIRKLRKQINPVKIRYYGAGEYGSRTKRPHYHILIFGYDWDDKILYKSTDKSTLWISEKLNKTWSKGFCTIGPVNYLTASYSAKYVTEKKTDDDYLRVDETTGEIIEIEKEFSLMSRKPGIGKDWIDKWKKDVYPSDFITHDGYKLRPPRYYDKQINEDKLKGIKNKRILWVANIDPKELEKDRLLARECVKTKQLSIKKKVF